MAPSYFRSLYIIVGIMALSFSCNTKDSETSIEELPQYVLEKVDSFSVENFTRVRIIDFSPEENIYLAYSEVEDDILELSDRGEILKRTHKKGDGPGLYGNWNPIGMGFGPNSERIVELPFALFVYDKDYEIISENRIMSPLPIRTNQPLGKTTYFENQDSLYFLVGPTNYLSAHYLIRDDIGKDTLQNFYELNLNSGATHSVVPYDEQSIYKNSEDLYFERMGKSFFIDHKKQELYILHDLEKSILVYGLPDYTLKEKIPVEHSEFLSFPAVPLEVSSDDERITDLRNLSAKNKSLIPLDEDLILMNYFTGISKAEYETRHSEEPTYSGSSDPRENKFLIFENRKQIPQELPGIKGSLILSLPDKKILVQERENMVIEEEFTRFSIYQLQTN